MRISFSKLAFLFLLSAFFWVSYTHAQSDADAERILSQLDNGNISGNVYENKTLGLRLKFPKTITPDSEESVKAIMIDAIKALKKENSSHQRIYEEMLKKDRMVFSLDLPEFKDSLGATLSLTIKKDETLEDLRSMTDRTIDFFINGNGYKLFSAPKDHNIAGINGITYTISNKVNDNEIFLKNFCFRRNGHLIVFTLGYVDKNGLSEMEKVLSTMETF